MVKELRAFVASPGDVPAERKALAQVVDEVNQTHGQPLGYRLELVRWETHTAPGAGPPQQVINPQIGGYDIFIGMMWRRFGTPTPVAGSGTEEEFRIAYRVWEQNPRLILMFYFCQKPFMPRSIEELDQMRQVLTFRKELEGKALVWDYRGPDAFTSEIRKHLCMRISSLMEEHKSKSRRRPDDESIGALKDLWNRMNPDLQRAFNIAYNENRLAGDGGIKTQDLFSALLRVSPEHLRPIVEEIPRQALPAPTSGELIEGSYILQERPWLSHCVVSSIRRLSKQLPSGQTLTAADIFADIAKNGTGQSVRLLREHNIGPETIDRILREKNIQVVGG